MTTKAKAGARVDGRFAARPKRGATQRTLDQARKPSGHGGWRPGAGRKPSGKRVGPAHRPRAAHAAGQPIHVGLRTVPEVGRLRRSEAYRAAHGALARMLARVDFRVVHVSIQHNHVHLLVEADDAAALARGIQAFCISMARRLNRLLGRSGRVFAHRYQTTVVTHPQQARRVLAYVLNNWRRHREDFRSAAARRAPVDPYSSGPSFDGWRELDEPLGLPADYAPLPVARPTVWLLTTGWRRHRPIGARERPGPLVPKVSRS